MKPQVLFCQGLRLSRVLHLGGDLQALAALAVLALRRGLALYELARGRVRVAYPAGGNLPEML